jgi:hypothetical protein
MQRWLLVGSINPKIAWRTQQRSEWIAAWCLFYTSTRENPVRSMLAQRYDRKGVVSQQ